MSNDLIIGILALAAFVVFGYGRLIVRKRRLRRIGSVLTEGALLIDVRTAEEFRGGHLPGAVHVPLEKLAGSAGKLGKKDKPKVLYCASGARSRRGVPVLRSLGFSRVFDGGSMAALKGLI